MQAGIGGYGWPMSIVLVNIEEVMYSEYQLLRFFYRRRIVPVTVHLLPFPDRYGQNVAIAELRGHPESFCAAIELDAEFVRHHSGRVAWHGLGPRGRMHAWMARGVDFEGVCTMAVWLRTNCDILSVHELFARISPLETPRWVFRRLMAIIRLQDEEHTTLQREMAR